MAEIHSSGLPIVQAASACVWRGNDVLLVQRGNAWGRGYWSLPGGKREAGEPAQAAAQRELCEETGLVVELSHHVGDFGLQGPGVYYVISCWTGHYLTGEAKALSDAMDVAWVDFRRLGERKLAFNNDTAIATARTVLRL